ncbi:MipA/OmpV family protein [Pseudovibrio flavus]|uniref:MipA/OmpV family protein n=1 Tax=Pseudovibrio flavus TaxID=2529854 RepID=UPI00211C1410|nr:MipA/OmpV family protein [Pseudovibrio flavus]
MGCLLVFCGLSSTALADDFSVIRGMTEEELGKQYVVDFGLGVTTRPSYPGAKRTVSYPYVIAQFSRFYMPGWGQVREGYRDGLYFYPSFGAVGARKASDAPELRGTKETEFAYEVGMGMGYGYGPFDAFVLLRQGFGGHTGIVGRAGVDAKWEITDSWRVKVGPRIDFASEDYMQTYFGLTPSEAAASGRSAYKVGGGIKSYGVYASTSYDLTDKWTWHVQGGWERFAGDAGDSPLLVDDDSYSISTGLSYRFSFDLFD